MVFVVTISAIIGTFYLVTKDTMLSLALVATAAIINVSLLCAKASASLESAVQVAVISFSGDTVNKVLARNVATASAPVYFSKYKTDAQRAIAIHPIYCDAELATSVSSVLRACAAVIVRIPGDGAENLPNVYRLLAPTFCGGCIIIHLIYSIDGIKCAQTVSDHYIDEVKRAYFARNSNLKVRVVQTTETASNYELMKQLDGISF